MNGASGRREGSLLPWLAPAAVVLLTVAVFLPALSNGFVWDDIVTFTANPNYRGLGWTELRWMFTVSHSYPAAPYADIPYQPLTWLIHALDYEIWGLNPMGYHLTNILIHSANALLFYFLSLRLLAPREAAPEDRLAAACAALLFSLHPLRVEPVAWLAARGHIVSAFFYLLTLLTWLRAIELEGRQRRLWRGLAWTSCFLALLARSTAMSLPAVLVLLDVYPLRRLGADPREWASARWRCLWLEKIPILAMALTAALLELRARADLVRIAGKAPAGWAARLVQPLFALGYYLEKTLFPARLIPHYVWHWELSRFPYVFAAASALVLAAALIAARRRFPAGLAAFAFFAAAALPMIAVYKAGYETVCDRYTYVPCLAWALLAGAGLRALARARRGGPSRKAFLPAFAATAAVLALLSFLSWRQLQTWSDSIELWRHVLRVDPIDPMARRHLGDALLGQGRLSETALLWQEQLRLFPADEETRKALADVVKKNWGSAPAPAKLYNDAGAELLSRGEIEKAAWYFKKALKLDPAYAEAGENLRRIQGMQNRP